MTGHDIDQLLEQSLSGDPPDPGFRARVLSDSLAALHRARRTRTRYLRGGCGMAAAFIAGIAFLLGRCSAPRSPIPAIAAEATEEVTVSDDLVAWLEAANLFRQLNMPDRMARAVSRAGNLLPRDVVATVNPVDSAVADVNQDIDDPWKRPVDRRERLETPPSGECISRIMAQSLGD